jgi:hypothetical protein
MSVVEQGSPSIPDMVSGHNPSISDVVVSGTNRPAVVYLAGPYRPYTDAEGVGHSIAQNVREAGLLGMELWRRGYVALVPHTLTYVSGIIRNDGSVRGVSAEAFMAGELELVRRSDVLVLMPTWKYSKGAIAEKAFAESIGVPVFEWDDFLKLPRGEVEAWMMLTRYQPAPYYTAGGAL